MLQLSPCKSWLQKLLDFKGGGRLLRLSIWLEQSARDLMTEQFKMDEMHQLVANDMPLSLMNLVIYKLFFWQVLAETRKSWSTF